MAQDQITITTPTKTYVYNLMSQQVTNGTSVALFREKNSSLANPQMLRVSHETSKTVSGTDRHLVQFSRVDQNVDELPFTGSAHIVFAAPRQGVTIAALKEEYAKISAFLTSDHLDEILGGFFPMD